MFRQPAASPPLGAWSGRRRRRLASRRQITRTQARARMRTAWGWRLPRCDGVGVDLGRPGAGVAGVVGEVDQGVPELLVGGPAEARPRWSSCRWLLVTGAAPARAARDSSSGKRARTSPSSAEQGRGSDPVAGLGQAGEDVGVGVGLQAFDDLGFQLALLAADGLDGVAAAPARRRPSAVGFGGGQIPAGGAVVDAGEQVVDGFAAAVGDAAQERGQAGPGSAVAAACWVG